MRVFITGATGFIGTALTKELLAAGHQVLGMTRSEAGARALAAAGAEPHHATLEDVESLKAGAAQADGVVHLAFNHDFSRYMQNCDDDRRAIAAMGSVLAGSDRPLLVTSGTAITASGDGEVATEDGPVRSSAESPRAASDEAAAAAEAQGVNVSIVRLPQVHDTRRQGLITHVVEVARQKGVSPYVGEGTQRWAAAHISDVARLYRLAVEKAEPGARYHAVGEEGVPMRPIAEAIGRALDVPVRSITPEQAAEHFGWMGMFANLDMPASSKLTQEKLGWRPTGPGLLEDLARLEVEPA